MNLAEKGIITFVIGIHGIPVNMDPGVYLDLGSGALRNTGHSTWTTKTDTITRGPTSAA
jgi:hypothetical protein